jgi:tyrosyl-tRNA synthetase
MKIDQEKIKEILIRGVERIVDSEHLKNRLLSGEKLRIKFGIDPTASEIHLGNAVVMRKLGDLQDLGHQVIFLIGDYTAKIGDPSGRNSTRPILSDKEIAANMATYKKQAAKILDLKKIEIRHNSEWLGKMKTSDIFSLMQMTSLNRILEREDFSQRLKNQSSVSLSELLYPLFQGYDSVALKSDVELGGQDQLLNMLMGRELQGKFKQAPQDVMTFSLLEGLDGVKKMSKSYGNYVGITFAPNDMFGKVMSIPDNLILKYFTLCTDLSLANINKLEEKLKAGENPRNLKAQLAKEIVKIYHGEKRAEQAEQEFDKIFKEKEMPSEMQTYNMEHGTYNITELLVKTKIAPSKSEAQRLIEQGAVRINNQVEKDWRKEIKIESGMIVHVGKRKFIRLDVK